MMRGCNGPPLSFLLLSSDRGRVVYDDHEIFVFGHDDDLLLLCAEAQELQLVLRGGALASRQKITPVLIMLPPHDSGNLPRT